MSEPQLSDIEYSIFQQFPGCWGCKDRNSVFRYTNDNFTKLLGFEHASELVGLSDAELPCPSAKCADDFRQQDQFVMQSEKTLKILDVHPYPDGQWRVHLFTKLPWRDSKGDIQGIIFFGQEVSDTAVLEVGHWICSATGLNSAIENHIHIDATQPVPMLTCREEEVLFMLLYGRKPQNVAKVMGISVKTVEGHVARLRTKFEANSKQELIEKSLKAGLGSKIPQSLLQSQFSVILHGD